MVFDHEVNLNVRIICETKMNVKNLICSFGGGGVGGGERGWNKWKIHLNIGMIPDCCHGGACVT